jgi:ribosomal protein S27E
MVQSDRPQMTIQYGAGALHAGQTKLQPHTYSEYVTLIACLRQQCLFEHASHSDMLHVRCLPCLNYFKSVINNNMNMARVRSSEV